jgi:hypothetical protein
MKLRKIQFKKSDNEKLKCNLKTIKYKYMLYNNLRIHTISNLSVNNFIQNRTFMLFGNNIWIGTYLKLFNYLLRILLGLLLFTIFKSNYFFILINFVSNITNLIIAVCRLFVKLLWYRINSRQYVIAIWFVYR